MKIHFVDALAGAGKTTSAIQYALQHAELGAKIAFVQPSTALIDQTFDDLVNANTKQIPIAKYHADCTSQVKDQVQTHLNESVQSIGEILLITHTTFLSLKYWHNSQDWNIIIDEIPQIYAEWERKLDVNFGTLMDRVELGEVLDGYAQLSVKAGCEAEIESMADNQYNDEQNKLYQDIAARLHNSEMWENVIHLESAEAVVSGTSKGKNTLITYSLLRPTVLAKFKSVTIMGAMFESSMLYLLWSRVPGLEFVKHSAITSGLWQTVHSNGHLLTIKYLYETNWSKSFSEKVVDGKTIYKTAQSVCVELMKGKDFIYACNNSDITGLRAGIRLSNISHGINEFQFINNAVFMSALNCNNVTFSFMKTHGISSKELAEAQSMQIMYQFVMRTSLRNPNDKSHKTVVVMDKRSAEYLASHFKHCTVEAVDGMKEPEKKKMGRPFGDKPAMTPAERAAKARAKKKAAKEQQQKGE